MAWALIEHRTVSAAQEDFTGLAGNDELLAVARLITTSSSGQRLLRASINNGSSFLASSGDYISTDGAGIATNVDSMGFHATSGNSTAGRSGAILLSALKLTTDKVIDRMNRVDARHMIVPASAGMGANDIDAVRFLNSAGNLSAGDIWLYGRGGAAAWQLIEARSVDGVEEFTGLGSYTEICILADDITTSGTAGNRAVQVGHGGGPTWLTSSGDYKNINSDGTESDQSIVSLHQTGSNSARGGILTIHGFNLSGAHKIVQRHTRVDIRTAVIENTNSLTAVRVTDTAGTPTGGTIYLYGRS